MTRVAMRQHGAADGRSLPGDGQYLQSFDFEAHNGRGEISHTPNLAEAMIFADMVAAFEFYRRSPSCRPTRADGKPNRPLTAANWEFVNIADDWRAQQ